MRIWPNSKILIINNPIIFRFITPLNQIVVKHFRVNRPYRLFHSKLSFQHYWPHPHSNHSLHQAHAKPPAFCKFTHTITVILINISNHHQLIAAFR